MTGCRRIDNGLIQLVPTEVQHFSDQNPGANSNSLARLKINLYVISAREFTDTGGQLVPLVARQRDVMPTTKVDPL